MTNYKIFDLPASFDALAAGDLFGGVDVSDTSTAPADANGSTKKILAAQAGDQFIALARGLNAGAGLTSLQAAIANRNSARCDIVLIGDSVTEGQGASLFANRWAAVANQAFRKAYPTTANGSGGGLGFIPVQTTGANTYTWPIANTAGTPGFYDLGPVRGSTITSAAGTTWTFTAPAGTTSVKIVYFDIGYSGSFTYKVNSGSTTTVSNTSTLQEQVTSSIPMTGGDVLTIVFTTGTGIILDGILHFAGDENSGVTLHGCGHFGWCAGTMASIGWNQPQGASLNWAQAYAHAFPTVPAAIAIMLGINDARVTSVGSGGGRTAAQFASDVQGLLTTIRGAATALANVPAILVIPYQANETVQDTGGWPAYAAALRAVAAADPVGAMVVDLGYRLPTVAAGYDGGILYTDNYHPTDLGHLLSGKIIAGGMEALPPEPASAPAATYPTGEALASGETSLPRYSITGDLSFSSGVLALGAWTAVTSGIATSVRVGVGATAAAGLTYAAVGIYSIDGSGNGTLVASTGDVHGSAFGSTFTAYDLAFSGGNFNRQAGKRYAVGILCVGTTPPSFGSANFPNYVFGQLQPWLNGGIGSLSVLPASFAAGSLGFTNGPPACRVSP